MAAAITSGIAVGFLVGLINAFLVIIVKIPTFVATLGTMFVMQGLRPGIMTEKRLPSRQSLDFPYWGRAGSPSYR
ncbi:MAG: ABC transporter permease subunit [[Clostridium] scindens]